MAERAEAANLDWFVEQLFRISAFLAFVATIAIAGWLRDRGVPRRLVKFLGILAGVNCVLAILIVGLSRSELESLGYEFLLPFFVAIFFGIIATLGYLCVRVADRKRLIVVGVLWCIAALSFVSFSVSEYFGRF
ncbi:hypothetical protein ACSBLW_12200 [Thioclava sp. FR2]|uniref:hypothetical protein n=1 Tax=Thioclava sp. FR2 TaxID=3445780 RepID=UPI003EBAB78A